VDLHYLSLPTFLTLCFVSILRALPEHRREWRAAWLRSKSTAAVECMKNSRRSRGWSKLARGGRERARQLDAPKPQIPQRIRPSAAACMVQSLSQARNVTGYIYC
jgi:hypothetical protein